MAWPACLAVKERGKDGKRNCPSGGGSEGACTTGTGGKDGGGSHCLCGADSRSAQVVVVVEESRCSHWGKEEGGGGPKKPMQPQRHAAGAVCSPVPATCVVRNPQLL